VSKFSCFIWRDFNVFIYICFLLVCLLPHWVDSAFLTYFLTVFHNTERERERERGGGNQRELEIWQEEDLQIQAHLRGPICMSTRLLGISSSHASLQLLEGLCLGMILAFQVSDE
jgi:hypothetical protein